LQKPVCKNPFAKTRLQKLYRLNSLGWLMGLRECWKKYRDWTSTA
jgi:hypothetical protein